MNYKFKDIFSILILLCYGSIIIFSIIKITDWPSVGNVWLLLILCLLPAFIYRLINIIYLIRNKNSLTGRWKKIAIITISIILSIGLTRVINEKASLWAMERFDHHYQPLIEQLSLHTDDLCQQLNRIVEFQQLEGQQKPKALYFKGDVFTLLFSGNSIDIDGSTVYWDSRIGQWHIFHNDNQKKQAQLNKLTQDMSQCDYSANYLY